MSSGGSTAPLSTLLMALMPNPRYIMKRICLSRSFLSAGSSPKRLAHSL